MKIPDLFNKWICRKPVKLGISFAFILVVLFLACQKPESPSSFEVPRENNPKTPKQDRLEPWVKVNFQELAENLDTLDSGKVVRVYSRDGNLFSGWAKQIFEVNEHRFRCMYFQEGLVEWQIGYFDNGDLDHDFHMKDGNNFGSQRMSEEKEEIPISTRIS